MAFQISRSDVVFGVSMTPKSLMGIKIEIGAACYREKAQIPKVPGRVLGRVPVKSGLLGTVLGGRFC